MDDKHLKEGELEELMKYFMTLGNIANRRGEWIPKQMEELEQQRLAYASHSTYGRTPEEISRNAKQHLLDCPECYDQYRRKIERNSKMFVRALAEVAPEVIGKEIDEATIDETTREVTAEADKSQLNLDFLSLEGIDPEYLK